MQERGETGKENSQINDESRDTGIRKEFLDLFVPEDIAEINKSKDKGLQNQA